MANPDRKVGGWRAQVAAPLHPRPLRAGFAWNSHMNGELHVLYEDYHLIIVNKPAPLLTQARE